MAGKKPGLSVKSVTAMGILLVLLLSFITYPFGFMVHAQTQPSEVGPLTILKSNNTVLDYLSDAGITLSDGTNVLNTEPTSDPSTDALNDVTSPVSDSTTDSSSGTTSSDSNDDATTGEVGSSDDATTGEVGSSDDATTGEVGSSDDATTGEVGSSDDATTGEVGSSDDATTGEVGSSDDATTGAIEPEGNVSTTDEGPAKVDSASATEPLVSASPPAESGEASLGAEIGVSDHSSPSSTIPNVAVNDNSLTSNILSGSAAEASAENPNAVVQPITLGDEQTVTLGDVSNSDGTSAQISLDKESYAPGDTAQVTLQDPDADIDSSVVNTVQIIVGASDSNPAGSTVTLTETAANSGKFVGTFEVPTAGDNIKVSYDASRPQARAVINGVSQGGAVEVQEIPVSSFQTLGGGQPDVMIGNGIQVTLVDGAELGSNAECEETGLPPPCGGSTNVTLSYANAPSDFNGQNPSDFTIWQYIPVIDSWKSLRDCETVKDLCAIAVHADTKTVSAISPYGPGIFVIGVDTGGSGGGGGGAGFPGAGLVLDLIAPIVASEPPTPTPEPPSTSTDSTTGLLDTARFQMLRMIQRHHQRRVLNFQRLGLTLLLVPAQNPETLEGMSNKMLVVQESPIMAILQSQFLVQVTSL